VTTNNYVLKDYGKRHLGIPDKRKVMSLGRLEKHLKVYNKTDDFKSFYITKRF